MNRPSVPRFTCSFCSEPIDILQSKYGMFMRTNLDGYLHVLTCPAENPGEALPRVYGRRRVSK